MNSATQSNSAEDAKDALAEAARLRDQGWRMASPTWFPLLVSGTVVLASAPAGLLLGTIGAAGLYWPIAAVLSAVLCAWYFLALPAQAPARTGGTVLATGISMLVAVLLLLWFAPGDVLSVAPWLVLGAGFAVFGVAWRSIHAGAFAAITLVATLAIVITGPGNGDVILGLVVGLAAISAAAAELLGAARTRR
ncbi:hypothetical protein HT102_12050 [Hoyosella sp. G463]|uniref:Uncharacterized protein n=1 Tax=Lolliginicoccus lacisalsi TaxID=2742202 RepID=A0A927PMW7_9ACTN|nr:hypothetical protein [Lolliginicoccus lacisalsi]MBD8507217.1 hypothetical protein [Lolliginicoccus lacisalsi]